MQEYHHVVAHCSCHSEFAGIDSHVFTKKNYHGIYVHVLQEQKYILLQFARLQYQGLINSLMDSWELLGSASGIMKARRVRDNDFQEASISPQWQGGESRHFRAS
jgi:hypothetical protein